MVRESIDLQNFIIWWTDFVDLEYCFQYKPGLVRIQFLVDEDGCKRSWGNIGVMRVFIYVEQKCSGPLLSEVWKMVRSQGKVREFCNEN